MSDPTPGIPPEQSPVEHARQNGTPAAGSAATPHQPDSNAPHPALPPRTSASHGVAPHDPAPHDLSPHDLSRHDLSRHDLIPHDLIPDTPQHPGTTNEPLALTPTGIRFLDAALDKAVSVPSAVIRQHVAKLRERNPHATPAQVIAMLERQYLLTIAASGGAVGAAAATPAVGTGAATALTTGEIAAFFAASAAFSLAVAEVHGIEVDDTARRRALVLATILGDQGATTVGAETGLGTRAWARGLMINMPTTTIRRVNTALSRRLLRRQATRQGALALGRLIPFGIGAVIGVTGARALGRTVVTGAQQAFGPPPHHFPRTIEVVVAAQDLDRLPTRNRRPHLSRRITRRREPR